MMSSYHLDFNGGTDPIFRFNKIYQPNCKGATDSNMLESVGLTD